MRLCFDLVKFSICDVPGAPGFLKALHTLARVLEGRDQYPVITLNYLYTLIVFALLFAFRHFLQPIRLLDFMADISYPFHIMHPLIGYSIIRFLIDQGVPFYLGSFFALCFVCVLAYTVHRIVELLSITFGKHLARKYTPRPP